MMEVIVIGVIAVLVITVIKIRQQAKVIQHLVDHCHEEDEYDGAPLQN